MLLKLTTRSTFLFAGAATVGGLAALFAHVPHTPAGQPIISPGLPPLPYLLDVLKVVLMYLLGVMLGFLRIPTDGTPNASLAQGRRP